MVPDKSRELELDVIDIQGRIISTQKVNKDSALPDIKVFVGETSGFYVLTLKENGVIVDTKKIIK